MPAARTRRLMAGLMALALAAATSVAIVPSVSAAPSCRVRNVATNVTKHSLQGAVNAANRGATLEVKGLCVGGTTINKNLTIIGKRTAATGKPILNGNDTTRVVWVRVGRQVSIRSLTILHGLAEGAYPANSGGGIRNDGTLTLTDVIVRDNAGVNGGGVSTAGKLILKGATQITRNHADDSNGGGVDVDSTDRPASLVMNGTSSIHHNSARGGGGVHIWIGSMVMNDASSVHHNSAEFGAGIQDQGSLTMNDSSVVRHNSTVATGLYGGGVEVSFGSGPDAPTFTMADHSRVRNNVAGINGGGVMIWPDCGLDPVLHGLTPTRVVDNTPAEVVTLISC